MPGLQEGLLRPRRRDLGVQEAQPQGTQQVFLLVDLHESMGEEEMIERQVIVTWTEPEKKKPEPDVFAILTVSAKVANVTYDHAFALATWGEEDGWIFDDPLLDGADVTVHAWADLEPYGGKA